MKAYTDLEQSKKLAEILPTESADMFLALNGTLPVMSKYIDDGFVTADNTAIPCWSLAALLIHIPNASVHHTPSGWQTDFSTERVTVFGPSRDNPLDATVEMIFTLKGKDLL